MDILILIGRILFVAVFAASAIGHLTQSEQMGQYAEMKGVRPGKPLTILTGLQILLGAVLVLFGVYADLGALLLAAFVIPTAFLMHAFWKVDDAQAAMAEQSNFMKNISLGGAAIALFAVFAALGDDLAYTLTGPLFSL